jgi:Ni,Fe-hydrogenase III small subunit
METTRQPRGAAVWVLPLDSSGCGACTQQIYALLSPQYAAQMRARGISLARSPRHADVVLITGALTEAARTPIQSVLASVPQPRALVSVGNCAIDGCVFRGSPHLIANVAETLDVNVEIAGCPPAPQAILDAITQAAQLLSSESDADDVEDVEVEDVGAEADSEADAEDETELAAEDEAEDEPEEHEEAASDGPRASKGATNGRGGSR